MFQCMRYEKGRPRYAGVNEKTRTERQSMNHSNPFPPSPFPSPPSFGRFLSFFHPSWIPERRPLAHPEPSSPSLILVSFLGILSLRRLRILYPSDESSIRGAGRSRSLNNLPRRPNTRIIDLHAPPNQHPTLPHPQIKSKGSPS